jgi:pSer/pThr/pTyr-binding forkhead associated (FHA) protein
MAIMRDADGIEHTLQPEHLIGRAPGCALRIDQPHVSAQHATLRWNGQSWELKDLGSRNGTYLDGRRIAPGQEHRVRRGISIAFGKATPEWTIIDDSPAEAMVVSVNTGEPILLEGELFALPSNDEPRVTIYRDAGGQWFIEHQNEATTSIGNLQTFEVGGEMYRFCCPDGVHKTVLSSDAEVRELTLRFSVSLDEEHVQLIAECQGRVIDLGARGHHYLLLTLARQRMKDAAAGVPEASCGWAYQEEFSHDPSMGGQQLNLDVFRIRKQFAALPLMDAANIVERRPRTRQLRIGTGRLFIATS